MTPFQKRRLRIASDVPGPLCFEGVAQVIDAKDRREIGSLHPFAAQVHDLFKHGFGEGLCSPLDWAHSLDCDVQVGDLYAGIALLFLIRWREGLVLDLGLVDLPDQPSLRVGTISPSECQKLTRLRKLWKQGVRPLGRAVVLEAAGVSAREDRGGLLDLESVVTLAALRSASEQDPSAYVSDWYDVALL